MLFGDDSVEYGMALSQNPDLVERLGNLVTGVRVLTSDLDKLRDMLAPPPYHGAVNVTSSNRLLATINLALKVEAWLPELRARVELCENPILYALRMAQRKQPHQPHGACLLYTS